MADFAFTCSATDTQLRNFYEQKKNVVWDVVVQPNNADSGRGGTAFGLDDKGLLMTCAHIFPRDYPKNDCTVYVRGLKEKSHRIAEVLEFKREWDIVLLQVKEVKNNKYNYAALSDNGELSVDQILVHIGHPRTLFYSYLVGKTAYKCIKSPPIPRGKTISCEEYGDTVTTPATLRGYRILGDKYPTSLIDTLKQRKTDEEDEEYEAVEDYRLPIVQMYTSAAKTGSSGGPTFDGRGDVVGMVIQSYGSYCIATHVSVLRVFLDEWKRKVAHQFGGSS